MILALDLQHVDLVGGGVEVVDVSLVRPPGKEFASASLPKTWMFVRSPADIFFYSGHGAWWDGNLLRDQGNHHSDSWLEPNELLGCARRPTSRPRRWTSTS